jgi:hypothetical protein
VTAAAPHPLRGVRLGKMERWLLLHAPTHEALFGLVLDQPDRGVREQLGRAAVKLEHVGLVDRARMRVYVRARDPRAERLIFQDNRFWLREDPSRAHGVRRNVVWLTPFGLQIVLRYRPQLAGGAPIRWDPRTVHRARECAPFLDATDRRTQLAYREEVERDAVILADPARRQLKPAVPSEVENEADLERWELAVAVARHRDPAARPEELWDVARDLSATVGVEALRSEHASIPASPDTRSERFRRRPHSRLGFPAVAPTTGASPDSS